MQFLRIWFFAIVVVVSLVISSKPNAQGTVAESVWWPSEWGKEDQRGAANQILRLGR